MQKAQLRVIHNANDYICYSFCALILGTVGKG